MNIRNQIVLSQVMLPNQANVVTTTPPKSAPKDIPVSAEMFYCRTALSASTGMPSNAAL